MNNPIRSASLDLQKVYLLIVLFFALLIPAKSQAVVISDLTITEVMANPSAVSDTVGEWFEIYNPTTEALDLNGLILSDAGSNSHTINTTDPLFINPDQYFVFGRNGDSAINGDYLADYVYSGFTLSNTEDEIFLADLEGNLLSLSYESGFVKAGSSSELINVTGSAPEYGFTDFSTYGSGDFGTPGAAGSYQFDSAIAAVVPEPSTLWLLLAGSLLLSARAREMSSI